MGFEVGPGGFIGSLGGPVQALIGESADNKGTGIVDINPREGESIASQYLGLPKVRDLVKGLTGMSGAEAALRGADLQYAAAMEGIAEQRAARESIQEDLAPFLSLGESNIGALQAFADPSQQASFVLNNPLFQQLAQDTTNRVMDRRAAQGILGSTGTASAVGKELLPLGIGFAQQQRANLLDLVRMGQNAAALQGSSTQQGADRITDLITGAGAAQSAGGIGAANSMAQGGANIAGLASSLISAFSDIRLKRNINKVGERDGMGVYDYQYLWSDDVYRGYIAQEVQKVRPDAVFEVDGFLAVNYGAL